MSGTLIANLPSDAHKPPPQQLKPRRISIDLDPRPALSERCDRTSAPLPRLAADSMRRYRRRYPLVQLITIETPRRRRVYGPDLAGPGRLAPKADKRHADRSTRRSCRPAEQHEQQ